MTCQKLKDGNSGWTVRVDAQLCHGHAICAMELPTIFEMDYEAGIAKVIDSTPDDSLRQAVEKVAQDCPVRAILVDIKGH